MDFIGKRYLFLGLSAALVVASFLAISFYGFNEGIDFTGGALWTLRFASNPEITEVTAVLESDLGETVVGTLDSNNNYLLRFGDADEERHQYLFQKLSERFPGVEELSFQSIGPSIGTELRRNALVALVLVLVGISIYIAFAFRKVSRPVSSWKYGAVTLVTLLHDIVIPAGMFALLGHFVGAEVDTNFIVALLVVMGFSVHDTIVVFDRTRENLIHARDRERLSEIVNQSLNETFVRSVNTSLTLIIVLVALLLLGPASLHLFILTILVGVVAGTYSSIFVASPLLTVWYDWSRRA